MRRLGPLLLLIATPALASHVLSQCGTTRETPQETLFFHRQALRARAAQPRPLAVSANRDIGNIAIIEDADGVVARQNQFNLDLKTLQFTPTAPNAAHYRYAVTDNGYDAAAASAGTPLAALDDDDTRQFTLPFAFPFFGVAYTQIFVNSDGNLTFTIGDFASTDRSLGRMTAGPPRISPLFDDLAPALTAGGVRMLADTTHVVVSWVSVPEWEAVGLGAHQTFQVKLYPDGRIEFSYSGINATSAVVGIAPGNLLGTTTLVDFRNDPTSDYSAAVAERFGNSLQIDVVTAAQKFYQTHEDSYDYLVIYNNEDIAALGEGVLAYESTVRNNFGSGYGVPSGDAGSQYGSASRLQSVLNLGMLSQYPTDVTALVPARAPQGDTPLSIIAHETGHLFLAFASIADPNNPGALPMLGYQNAHWSFAFNSEASVMEGERIVDQGPNVSPEFLTTDTVQAYAPLDQYLMGFRAPIDVPDTFLVTGVPYAMTQWHPLRGYGFNGQRQNIGIDDVIQAMGRRTPDSTVAQRNFRFAFIMIVAQGSTPSAANLSQIDTYRQQFETFYATASSNNAVADTSLKRSLKLSLFPAGGVVAGAVAATITVQTPPATDLTVTFQAPNGYASLPPSLKIPAGATSASFTVLGLRAGVEEVSAVPSDSAYETAFARVQVADASLLKLVAVSGDRQVSTSAAPLPDPIVVSLTDVNNLAYPGARIVATASAGGTVSPSAGITDPHGQASFRWTPGAGGSNQLQLAVDTLPAVSLTVTAGSAVPVISAVGNAGSFDPGMAAGALEAIQGVNLAGGQTATAPYPWPTTMAGVQVLLNGAALPLSYVSDTQINLYVPQDVALETGTLTVVTPSGTRTTATVSVAALQPGIFAGGVIHAGTTASALTTPVQAGDYIEIYCTGLGPTQLVGGFEQTVLTPTVFIGAVPLPPVYSGLTPGFVGLYQIDVLVPGGLASGTQSLLLSINQSHSNEVSITVK